jgi:hypothetical protein
VQDWFKLNFVVVIARQRCATQFTCVSHSVFGIQLRLVFFLDYGVPIVIASSRSRDDARQGPQALADMPASTSVAIDGRFTGLSDRPRSAGASCTALRQCARCGREEIVRLRTILVASFRSCRRTSMEAMRFLSVFAAS